MSISEEDMKNSSGGGKSWDHEAIQEFFKDAYEQVHDEEGDDPTERIALKLSEIGEEWYDGTVEDLRDLKYTNPNVNRTLRGNLPKAGFREKSVMEDRKWAVATETKKDGEVIFKVELTPLDE
ncbi:MAG: hypothetical protein ABEK17_03750 [Candidatus Aenigmatarchaeota archaeon]